MLKKNCLICTVKRVHDGIVLDEQRTFSMHAFKWNSFQHQKYDFQLNGQLLELLVSVKYNFATEKICHVIIILCDFSRMMKCITYTQSVAVC